MSDTKGKIWRGDVRPLGYGAKCVDHLIAENCPLQSGHGKPVFLPGKEKF